VQAFSPAAETKTRVGDLAEALGISEDAVRDLVRQSRQAPAPVTTERKKRPFLRSYLLAGLAALAVIAGLIALDPMRAVRQAVVGDNRAPDGVVRYGPDYSPFPLDASYRCPVSIPPGYSISSTGQGLIWGAGDHHMPNQPPVEGDVRRRLEEAAKDLAAYCRKRAYEGVRIPGPPMMPPDSLFRADEILATGTISFEYWNGMCGASFAIPKGTTPADDAKFKEEVARQIKPALDTLAYYVREKHKSDR